VFVGLISPDRARLTYASAGHPAPILRAADVRGAVPLTLGGPPLGVMPFTFEQYEIELQAPWLLVTYTDGLIERTGDAVRGEQAVIDTVANDGIAHAFHPATYIRERALGKVARDDTAIMTLRCDGVEHWRFGADDALRAEPSRSQFMAWLADRCTGDFAGAELIYGELVGNVVRHAPGPIDIDVECDARGVVLHVLDSGKKFDVNALLPQDILSESGRGLFLIGQFGEDLRSESLPVVGHQLSVRLPLRRIRRRDVAETGREDRERLEIRLAG
jgi:hypothetical protein